MHRRLYRTHRWCISGFALHAPYRRIDPHPTSRFPHAMRTHLLFSALALFALAACSGPGPIAGGPCAYETDIIEATAVEVDAEGALFDSAEGEVWVPAAYLGALPEPGETLTLKRERITEGTCTPEIYSVVTPSPKD